MSKSAKPPGMSDDLREALTLELLRRLRQARVRDLSDEVLVDEIHVLKSLLFPNGAHS